MHTLWNNAEQVQDGKEHVYTAQSVYESGTNMNSTDPIQEESLDENHYFSKHSLEQKQLPVIILINSILLSEVQVSFGNTGEHLRTRGQSSITAVLC